MKSPEEFLSFSSGERAESSKKESELQEIERAKVKSFENGAFWFLALRAKERTDQIGKEKGRITPDDQKEITEETILKLKQITHQRFQEFEQKYGNPPRRSSPDFGFELSRIIPLISLRSEGYLDFGGPTGKIRAPSRETYFEAVENYLRKSERDPATHSLIQNHIEGFCEAALQEGEIDTATRGFIVGGQIENPEIRKRIEGVIEKMINSENEEERKRAERAKQYLEKHFEKGRG